MTLVMPAERFMIRGIKAFADATVDELVAGKEIHAVPIGEWVHPLYGEVKVDSARVDTFKKNFDDGVYGQEIPISFEHFGMDASKGTKAAGWIKGVRTAADGMHWLVSFTEEAAKEIKDKAWKYFSPEWWDDWTDGKGVAHKDVVVGGALTNRPFFKGMIPLNFSEVEAISEEWDKEHSEPGSDDTPHPSDGRPEGTRGEDPDVTYTQEELEQLEARSMEEFLAKLREALGLDKDKKEEDVLVAMSELVAEVKPLRDAAAAADAKSVFSEQFPAEYAKMQKLEEDNRTNNAKSFAERYSLARVVEIEKDDEGKEVAKPTPFGFSALTVTAIEDLYLAFSDGSITQKHIEDVLESQLKTGLVDYSERGTSAVKEEEEVADAPKAFAEKVSEIMVADKLDRSDATRIAAEKHPELFRAYRETFSSRKTA